MKAKQTTAVGRGANRERGTRKKRRLVQRCARKERQRDQRGEKSAGRGKRYNRNRGALIKTPVGDEVGVNGGGREKETAAEVRWGSESKRQPGGRGAHEQKPLEREQEKRGANRNLKGTLNPTGRGKGWAKAEA